MGSTIYTYTFPFVDKQSQQLIIQAMHEVAMPFASHTAGDESSRYVVSATNHELEILSCAPRHENADTFPYGDLPYYVLASAITRDRPSTSDETITVSSWAIKVSREEYDAVAQHGVGGGLALLAWESIKAESLPPLYSKQLWTHRSKPVKPRHFSDSSHRAMHHNEIMASIGRTIGQNAWELYARDLTAAVLPDAPPEFRLFQVTLNTTDAHFPNTQYAGAWKDQCLIVCEELAYASDGDAIPRYALIPASSFSHDIYKGVGAVRELGLGILNSPGLSMYMRMRPSLAAPLGDAARNVLAEALHSAKERFGDSYAGD